MNISGRWYASIPMRWATIHNYMDKDDFLREMYLDTAVGHDEAGMKRYERMVNIVSSRFRHGPKRQRNGRSMEAMQKVISGKGI